MKNKIKTIVQSGTNQWKDKTLTKWFIMFEDDSNGTLTTGFDESEPPKIGDELEYETEDNGFGVEIKLPRKGGFKGGGFKKAPEETAMINTIALAKSSLEGGLMKMADIKAFVVEFHSFFMEFNNGKGSPEVENKEDKLPF